MIECWKSAVVVERQEGKIVRFAGDDEPGWVFCLAVCQDRNGNGTDSVSHSAGSCADVPPELVAFYAVWMLPGSVASLRL